MTLPEILQEAVDKTPFKSAFSFKDAENNWKTITWNDFHQKVKMISNSLLKHGIVKGDTFVIMLKPSLEWELLHHSALNIGAIVIGLEHDASIEKIEHIKDRAQARVFAIDANLNKNKLDTISDSKLIIAIEDNKNYPQFNKLVLLSDLENNSTKIKNYISETSVSEDDIAWIASTSGTTGNPTLISYTHKQINLAVYQVMKIFKEFKDEGPLISWLPLSSLFQRMLNICAISSQSHLYFVSEPQYIVNHLSEVEPKIFIGVPRFYEKLHKNFLENINKRSLICKIILLFLLKGGHQKGILGSIFRKINLLAFRNVRALFGTKLKYNISGSASLKCEILLDFYSVGILILEAYGLTECIVPISANSKSNFSFGTVGKILPCNKFRINSDNELLIKCKGIGKPYNGSTSYNDNYLHTGDIVTIDKNKFLKITGRKNEIFKTSTGKKIIPNEIEPVLNNYPLIENILIIGENRPFLICIISLRKTSNNEFFKLSNNEKSINSFKNFHSQILHDINRLPKKLQPVGLIIKKSPFTIEEKELTSNMKLRRKFVEQKYAPYIEMLYTEISDEHSRIHSEPIIIDKDFLLLKI